ncbi:ABC transporter permease [Leifsonia shinshuensis]
MKTTDLLRAGARNAFRSKTRTILTVLSLFVGAFTLTLTTALGAGVSDYVTKQVSSLGSQDVLLVQRAATATGSGPQKYDPSAGGTSAGSVGAPSPLGASGGTLSEADLETIRGIQGVDRVAPVQQVAVDWIAHDTGDKYKLTINATSSITKSDLAAGAQLDQGSNEKQLVLPQDYVEPLGFASDDAAVGAVVTLGLTDAKGQAQTTTAHIVGVARTSLLANGAGANNALIDALSTTQRAGLDSRAGYQVAIAYVAGDPTAQRIDDLKSALTKEGFTGQTVQDQLGTIQTVINGIIGVLNAFAIVALVAAAFGIVNTLFMSVQERTREIGLMKAMGMSSRKVFALFSTEAIVIGFLGSVLGVVVAMLLGTEISAVAAAGPLASLPGLTLLLFQPQAIVFVILAIMLIAFLAGVLPARRAARQNPIDSLRYE